MKIFDVVEEYQNLKEQNTKREVKSYELKRKVKELKEYATGNHYSNEELFYRKVGELCEEIEHNLEEF